MADKIDFHYLVNDVADGFEKTKEVKVTWAGRDALIQPALSHQDDVQRELDLSKITVRFLESCIFQVLENARLFLVPPERKVIDRPEVEESMKRYCPYLF